MSRCTQTLGSLLLALVTISVLAPSVLAQADSWAIAQRDEGGILKVVDMTRKFADQVPGGESAAAVILYKETNFRVDEEGHQRCVNLVFLVHDASDLDYLVAPWVEDVDEHSERSSFRVRGEKVQRYDEGRADVIPAEDQLHKDRVRFEFEDVQAGDVLGWSVVVKQTGPLFLQRLPAVDRYPVVYSSCRIFGDGQSNFSLTANGVPESELKVKTSGLINDRPEKWSANLKLLAAVEDLPLGSPYPLGTPVFNIALVERHLEIENFYTGWVPISGPVSCAGLLSAGRAQLLENAGGVDVHASALTTGLKTAEEKERAIYEFVRDSIADVRGDEYDLGAQRNAKEVLKSKQGTVGEKVALMISMLDAVGVSAEMGVARPGAWGPISEVKELSLSSFYTQLVRCGGKEGRIYVPQCAECAPGEVPADWGKVEVFSPKPGLGEELQAYNEKIRTAAFADAGRLDMRQIQLDAEAHGKAEGWYRIDEVGGN